MAIFLYLLVFVALVYGLVCVFYYFIQEKLIFLSFHTNRNYKYKVRLPYEELFLQTHDGAELHGLHFTHADPKGLVLYFHGNTGTLKRWAKNAHYFHANGYEVIMPDPRGYGKSKGKRTEAALIDDAKRWYGASVERCKEERIIIYGRSLGSALATPAAIDAGAMSLVLETPFASLYDVAKHFSALLPYRLLLKYPFENDKYIQEVKMPVYIFHGTKDLVVPYKSALKLYSCIPSATYREMITVTGGHHNDLAQYEAYHTTMAKVFEQGNAANRVQAK